MPETYSKILLSTAYFPTVIYFAYLIHAETVYLEMKETYTKQTYRNRCEICSANGKLRLSIPVIKIHGNHTKTEAIMISGQESWARNHWRAIESAYNASPFFLYYTDALKPFFQESTACLFDHNTTLLQTLCNLIDLDINFLETGSYKKEYPDITDLRNIEQKDRTLNKDLFPQYQQVFSDRTGFLPNLSILDLLFNEGPNTLEYLKSVTLPDN